MMSSIFANFDKWPSTFYILPLDTEGNTLHVNDQLLIAIDISFSDWAGIFKALRACRRVYNNDWLRVSLNFVLNMRATFPGRFPYFSSVEKKGRYASFDL